MFNNKFINFFNFRKKYKTKIPEIKEEYFHSYTHKINPWQKYMAGMTRLDPYDHLDYSYYINNKRVPNYEEILEQHGMDINNLSSEDKMLIDLIVSGLDRPDRPLAKISR